MPKKETKEAIVQVEHPTRETLLKNAFSFVTFTERLERDPLFSDFVTPETGSPSLHFVNKFIQK